MSEAHRSNRDGGCSPTTCSAQRSDTPETDAAEDEYIANLSRLLLDPAVSVNTSPVPGGWSVARQMERERDEAREEAWRWREKHPGRRWGDAFPWEKQPTEKAKRKMWGEKDEPFVPDI